FRKKLLSEEIRNVVLQFAQKTVEKTIFTKEKTILDWAKFFGLNELPGTIIGKVDAVIESQILNVRNTLSSKSIEQIIPDNVQRVIESKIPEAANYILIKGEEYFTSSKGEMTIRNMMDDFLSSKGTIGGMIQMLFGDSNTIVQAYAKKELAIEERFNKNINDYWLQGGVYVTSELLPKLIEKGFVLAESKLEEIVTRLNLQEVVREQVDSFPIEKLEELVLNVANRELKMIT
ncbi:hypothetical protein RhiirA1_483917, partial [Rhizophagus irregularis]